MTRKPLWPTENVYEPPGAVPKDPWVTFETPERIAMMPPKLRKVTHKLGIIVSELHSASTNYELFKALNDKIFLSQIANTPCDIPTRNIVVTLARTICIVISGIFDEDPDAVDIRKVAKSIHFENEKKDILDFQRQLSEEAYMDALRMFDRLKFIRRNMNTGSFPQALFKIVKYRNKRLAHYDHSEGQNFTAIPLREIKICFLNAARLSDLVCRLLMQRVYPMPEIRNFAKSEAVAFRNTLVLGAHGLKLLNSGDPGSTISIKRA